ncbi:hypothetical protein ACBZ91_18455 [Vibrio natriegens]|uniref:hypothetical protein n=1 Tax=Vibrio natriegens TaxID=691 RepID=UPI0035572695
MTVIQKKAVLNFWFGITLMFTGSALAGTGLGPSEKMNTQKRHELIRNYSDQLTDEQKKQIKHVLKEEFANLSDEQRSHLIKKLSGLVVSHPQALQSAINYLSDVD